MSPVVPTHYVGIDLAWGTRQPTGLAVLDADARLLHVSAVRTDDEIEAALASYVAGPCVVAIDAPLVVTNPTGNRPAERALNQDFRSYEAGAHPTNLGKPEFADGPRGGHLVTRLGLDPDPDSVAGRRAVEVYPHAAIVALFGLDRTLKYKNKKGRTFETLRGELLRLVDLVETVVPPVPTWTELRRSVEDAARKSELRVVEDQVDAVVCAYVALFATRHPDRMTTYGDLATGYILTPSLGSALVDDLAPSDPVASYAADRPALERAGTESLELVAGILDEAGINYLSVTGRTKSVASFADKATRTTPDGAPAYPDPLRDIGDQLGVRVITYAQSDVEAVAELLTSQLVVLDDRDLGRETASQGRFGYASRHLQVALDPARERQPGVAHLVGRQVQVQLRTVLQHAWAEFEHDIRYKGVVPAEHASEFDRRFTLAAGLLELADREFTAVRDRLRRAGPEPARSAPGSGIAPRELAAYLAGQYDDAGWSRPDHYDWIAGLLLDLGVTALDDLGELLRRVDEPRIAAAMDYRYPPGAVRRLDDALLLARGEEYVELPGNSHRRDLLRARLSRLRGEDE